MEISITSVIAQVINFGIVFFLFRKFLAKPIIKAIEERRTLIKKLENADKTYAKKIEEANEEAKKILQEWVNKRDALVMEAGLMANHKKDEILEEAKYKANKILEEVQKETEVLQQDLENNFEHSVKRSSLLVLQKLLDKDASIQSAYLDTIVKEITKK